MVPCVQVAVSIPGSKNTAMIVSKVPFPLNSILYKGDSFYHYTDSYTATLNDPDDLITAADVGKAFFTAGPSWASFLFVLRNKLVSLVGLKTSGKYGNREALLKSFNCLPGEQLGLFKVFARTENEVIMGEDDKHLDFRISLYLNKPSPSNGSKNLTISTIVIFHNWMGRLYFLPVKPIHRLIVPGMLRGIIRQLEKQYSTQPLVL